MSQTDPFRPGSNPGEYPEDPYAGESGAHSEFGSAESVPPVVPPTGTTEPVTPVGTAQPVPPFGTAEPVPSVGSEESSGTSTTDVAKDQASQVKDTTKQAGQQVAHEAKHQVTQVAGEAKNQAGNLVQQGLSEVRNQAGQQQQRLAESAHSIAKELGSMASSSDESGPMSGLAQEGSRRVGEVAHWLENHEPSDILEGLRSFARRRPGTFLLGAAAAGVLVGRLTRGIAAEAKGGEQSSGGSQSTYGQQELSSGYDAGYGTDYSTGYSTGTQPVPAGDQSYGGPAPSGPEFSSGPSTTASETGWDDTLPRGLGETGPR